MALIAQASIQAVIDACDMLEVVSPYTTLKKTGAAYMGRCPFHSEKTPSFSVDPVRKLYYCFGCGEGGNVFRFVQEKEGVDFAEAVRSLADKYGVRLGYDESNPEQERRRLSRDRLFSLLDQAAGYYARVLRESDRAQPARNYLKRRGFSSEIIAEFRLGFSSTSGSSLLKAASAREYSTGELARAGLIQDGPRGKQDRFRGRLMFPLSDHRGRVLGFGARVLDDSKPKYLNSPDTELYHKSKLVFGLSNARRAITRNDRVFVVEGYTDVMALRQVGVEEAVASMGTALTGQQLREISRFTRNVFLCFDADAAGQSAMIRAITLAKELDLDVRVIEIPNGQDPAEMVFAPGGAEEFARLGDGAEGLLEYQVQAVLSRHDLASTEGRLRAFRALAPVLAGAGDVITRDEQVRIIADRLHLSPENVAYLMESASSSGKEGKGDRVKRRVLSQEEITERSFLSLCLARADEAGRYLQLMTEAHFTTGINRSAFIWVKDRLGGADSGSAPANEELPTGGGLAAVLPELFIRAQAESSAPEALPELFMRLCEAELNRRIATLKESLGGDDSAFREIYRLEKKRREILKKIHHGNFETA